MTSLVTCRVDTSAAAEHLLEELVRTCGCERPDIRVTAGGSQTMISVQASSERAAGCAAEVMRRLGAAEVEQRQQDSEAATGPIDIARQPGEDRLPTPDELPVNDPSAASESVRRSRSQGPEIDADRRRSRAPYSGTERRTR
jgi:hypothetical protein